MKTFDKIFSLSFIWFGVFGIFYFYLEPNGISYIDNYLFTSGFFLVVIFFLSLSFKNEISDYIEKFSTKDLIHIIIYALVVFIVYFFIKIKALNSNYYDFKNILPPLFEISGKYFITKSFEIMFQQVFFMISIYYLFNNKISRKIDILLFGLYSMLIHLPILFVKDHLGKLIFPVSFFAGVIFSYFITKSKKGFIPSYMIHFGFYLLLAATFWFGGEKFILSLIN